eukprot:m.76036 g.76036  ORF g.76036 m.76036 type:complete len:126 (-) comp17209_c0_seq1:68-445(-)
MRLRTTNWSSWRVVHHCDIVPHLPLCNKQVLPGLITPVCDAFDKPSAPYHHGVEVFYNATAMPPAAAYTECWGWPHNEDFTSGCSNDVVDTCLNATFISDHTHYYNLEVASFGVAGCQGSVVGRR